MAITIVFFQSALACAVAMQNVENPPLVRLELPAGSVSKASKAGLAGSSVKTFSSSDHTARLVRRMSKEPKTAQAAASPGLFKLLHVVSPKPISALPSHELGASRTEYLVPINTECGYNMSGVSNRAMQLALSGNGVPATSTPELQTLQKQRIFIAACLHQSEEVLPHWTTELLRLIIALRYQGPSGAVDNLFVSVYESGSTDHTGDYLEALKGHLTALGVPHQIVRGNIVRGHRNRIDFLADVRNKALEPLVASQKAYDRVLWLNDIFFCADGALQLAFHALPALQGGVGADAVCGMDYQMLWDKKCGFYDIWASKDINGLQFNLRAPVTHTSERSYARSIPFQVFSCWNGMVSFTADLFQQQKVKFRRNHALLGECAASETELLARDMWKLGRGKFAVSPTAASAYTQEHFGLCSSFAQPDTFHHVDPIDFAQAPPEVDCCPLEEHSTLVDFNKCYLELWDRFNVEGLSVPKTGLVDQRSLAVGSIAVFLLTITLTHAYAVDRRQRFTAVVWSVFSSSILLSILNQVLLAAMPFPVPLLTLQMFVAACLLLAYNGASFIREIREQLSSAICWSLLAPLSSSISLTTIVFQQTGSSSLLLAMHNALPLAMLVVEPVVFPGTIGPTPYSLVCLNGVAVATIFYAWTQMMDVSETPMTPLLVILCGFIALMRQLLLRHLCRDRSNHLSFGARALVDNLAGLAFVVPYMFMTELEIWQNTASSQIGVETLIYIFFSGCMSLCMRYYDNVLQSQVLASAVMTLETAKRSVMVFLALLFGGGSLPLVHIIWCFVSLLGCFGFAYDSNWGRRIGTWKLSLQGAPPNSDHLKFIPKQASPHKK